jgi:hypothetical protein
VQQSPEEVIATAAVTLTRISGQQQVPDSRCKVSQPFSQLQPFVSDGGWDRHDVATLMPSRSEQGVATSGKLVYGVLQ